ncbi:exosortase K [Pedobacter sp. MW01-1-1]|uniref:exosortase K n=1 Tax=Pedobacter sp. MW01-1-1 TaxID=3383027 RepID=UPI003FF0C5B9
MKLNRNTFRIAIGILLFLLLKALYTVLTTEQLSFILGPTNFLVSLLLSTKASYLHGIGYFHHDLNITIEKACSGFNFMLLSFILSYYLAVNQLKNGFSAGVILTISLIFSWILTVFVNASRIVSSVIINRSFFFSKSAEAVLHQTEGTFIYLFFLVLTYKALNYLLEKFAPNEKSV